MDVQLASNNANVNCYSIDDYSYVASNSIETKAYTYSIITNKITRTAQATGVASSHEPALPQFLYCPE